MRSGRGRDWGGIEPVLRFATMIEGLNGVEELFKAGLEGPTMGEVVMGWRR